MTKKFMLTHKTNILEELNDRFNKLRLYAKHNTRK